MEPTLMVIGLNHRTAPLAMRERFWIGENRRYDVLRQLMSAEGVEEVVVVSTCCRTEFLLWASEPTLAANSVLHFLSEQHGLKLSEWEHFYRRLDDGALTHIFRVACGLDSQTLCESHVAARVRAAWAQARTVGAAGRFLDAVLEKALRVSEQLRQETKIGSRPVSVPSAALELARQIFGSLQGRKVLLLGAGDMSEASARAIVESGAEAVIVIDQSPARAREMAAKLGGTAATLADRWKCMLRADIVISSTGCPHVVLTREEAERIAIERNRVPLVILDFEMPRDVDPEVRRVDGILLYDMDGLERSLKNQGAGRAAVAAEAEKIVAAEAQAFRSKLREENVSTIVALRRRLDQICRQELDSFIAERGPFTREQGQALCAITAQVTQKIASSLARELKEISKPGEQEQMTAAVTRLFRLEPQQRITPDTKLERRGHERSKSEVAISH